MFLLLQIIRDVGMNVRNSVFQEGLVLDSKELRVVFTMTAHLIFSPQWMSHNSPFYHVISSCGYSAPMVGMVMTRGITKDKKTCWSRRSLKKNRGLHHKNLQQFQSKCRMKQKKGVCQMTPSLLYQFLNTKPSPKQSMTTGLSRLTVPASNDLLRSFNT